MNSGKAICLRCFYVPALYKSSAGVQNDILARFCALVHVVKMPQCVLFSGFLASWKHSEARIEFLLRGSLVQMAMGTRRLQLPSRGV
mmetsp:Transcript_68796/g.173340  ORF Transcript_68796/g.173340 Transcript_68796/m.173340 type:complete len:87 (+) Transcript_68796:1445-1705(+)